MPLRATDWIVFACLWVLALTVVYWVLKTNQYRRSQDRLAASWRAAAAGSGEWNGADLRPWIGLTGSTTYPLGKQGGGFAIKLQNFGKTPAVNVVITDYVRLENLGDLSGMQETANSIPVAVGTLMPDDKFNTNVWFKTSVVSHKYVAIL